MDQLNLHWTGGAELLDMMPQLHRTGRNTSTLDETADGYGVNPFPIGQCLSPLPGESPTAHTKPKRKAPKTAKDLEKKREYDRAYRRRCRENKKKTEQELFELTEENKKLNRENDYFKREEVQLQEMVQSQKDEMTLLQNELRRQKAQFQGQNVVVDVLSKQVASIDDNMDPQRENKRLKLEMDLLIKKINNDEYLNLIQLREKNIKLEQEKNDFQDLQVDWLWNLGIRCLHLEVASQVVKHVLADDQGQGRPLCYVSKIEGESYEMEGATASFWKRNYFQDLFDIDRELNASVFLEPAPSVAASSAELAINPFQNTTDTDRKRKGSGASRDAAAEKKRQVDKAYRERCKEMKKKTETKLDALTKENDGLRRENNYLKNEGTQLVQTLQHQKDGMKQLEKEFGQIKSQLHRQNTVVEVLSKRLGGSDDKDLQRENTQLKHDINPLTRKINNPESLSVIQLRAKIALLENEKNSLQVIVDALCEKINSEKDLHS
ncbi:hypothetical protein D5086_000673 [Populus alba]|uniref:Uncharacterized protein n=3 Tax=Populus alba TaxID=43335 RepID=A0A4U5MB20_POPAL|nr:hypothetical protein D5086_0000312640 [Populus alba]